ncbi:MAG TPA: hypothetical protein PLI53_11370 [Geobacteraceae bacterium]|nr:hypothetical protein [Geobacteraceae bacterium]
MNTPLLHLIVVGRRFVNGDQETRVLKGINLTVDAGELLAIVGYRNPENRP